MPPSQGWDKKDILRPPKEGRLMLKPSWRDGRGEARKNRAVNMTKVTRCFPIWELPGGIHHRDTEARRRLKITEDAPRLPKARQLWATHRRRVPRRWFKRRTCQLHG